jgi:hypothetical protein
MIFLTYNDNYSGIYKSQVIDVCRLFEEHFGEKVKLVALVSARNYKAQRRLIKKDYSAALVLPMFPKVRFWKINVITLFFCFSDKKVWARGPFAANLALRLKKMGLVKKIIFDARGAYRAELTEYNVVPDEKIKNSIANIEKIALLESDAQLAVSQKLKDWWKEQYAFVPVKAEVIPCTMSDYFDQAFPTEEAIHSARKALGFTKEDIVITYSGSSAGWQSFEMVDEFLFKLMSEDERIRLLFLSDKTPPESKTFSSFSGRIVTKWVKPSEVRNLLLACDYGLLIREKSVTNKVASPVKFAEYLSCGLQVIISEELGDFTEFVKMRNCGTVFSPSTSLRVTITPYEKKQLTHKLAVEHFSKTSGRIPGQYSKLLFY